LAVGGTRDELRDELIRRQGLLQTVAVRQRKEAPDAAPATSGP
jgi:hypothetical protein